MGKRLLVAFALVLLTHTVSHAQNPPSRINEALADLSARAGRALTLADLSGWRWDPVTYPDASLGCPQAGQTYTQVQTDGYQFLFVYDGATYDYRASADGALLFLCSGPAAIGNTPTPTPVAMTPTPPPIPTATLTALPAPQITALPTTPITVENASTLTALVTLPVSDTTVSAIAWSGTGQTLVAATTNGIRVYDAADLRLPPRNFDVPGGATAVKFTTHASGLLISGHPDTIVRAWDIATGGLRAVLRGHIEPVLAVDFSSDGQLAASAGDLRVILWDLGNRAEIDGLQGHAAAVTTVAFSPDGMLLASGAEDSTVRVWDVLTSALTVTLSNHDRPVRAVAFSPDGSWLASAGDDGAIRFWEIGPGTDMVFEGHTASVTALNYHPDGTLLASASEDGTVRLWDLATGAEIAALDAPNVSDIAFRPDGLMLAIAIPDEIVLWGISP